MYTLIGSERSRTFRVLWLLEAMGVDFTHQPEAPHSDPVKANSFLGKIPVLLVDDEPIRDSTAILTYLSDKHGQFTHAPGTVARGQQDAWTQAILDDIDAVLWAAARHSFVLPEDKRVPEVKDSLKWEYERNLKRITDNLTGPFLMGDTMTVPDIILAHCGGWAFSAGFPSDNADFKAYLKNMRARPAFQKLTAS